LLERRGIRILARELRAESLANGLIHDQVIPRPREQLAQRDLVIFIRLEPELAAMKAVGENALVKLGDRERLGEILRMSRAYDAGEMPEHSIEVVHVVVLVPSSPGKTID